MTRKLTITVEGDGPGADSALARIVEALKIVTAKDDDPEPPRVPPHEDRA